MPYSRANGVDIWYEVAGDGPAMVLIHANPFDHDLWMYQAAHFSTWFKVVGIDIRGYGRSAKVTTPYTLKNMCDDAVGVMVIAAARLRCEIGEITADLAHVRRVRDVKTVRAVDLGHEADPSRRVERERVVQYADERSDGARGVVVLGAAEQERAAPLDVAQVHVVAEADADDRPRAVDHEHELGLGIVPDRRGMNPDPRADAHRRHRRALREELRVRADADFEVLGPHALRDEHVSESHVRLGIAWILFEDLAEGPFELRTP